MINKFSSSNLSFGTFQIPAKDADPIQKKFLDGLTTALHSRKGATVFQEKNTGDVFVKLIPDSNKPIDRLETLDAEGIFAENIFIKTGLQSKTDISGEIEKIEKELEENPPKTPLEEEGVDATVDSLMECVKTNVDFPYEKESSKIVNFSDLTKN